MGRRETIEETGELMAAAGGLTAELEDYPLTAVGVTPGWLRSEKMLENFGVTEDNWRDACVERPGFGISESPSYVGRGVAELALAADVSRWAGAIISARQLAHATASQTPTGAGRTAGDTSPLTAGIETTGKVSTSFDDVVFRHAQPPTAVMPITNEP
jgi:hypothetical protein